MSFYPKKKRPRQEPQPHEMRVIKKIKGMHSDVFSMRSPILFKITQYSLGGIYATFKEL